MKEAYERYLKKWEELYFSNNRNVPWDISNNIGDPFNYREWLNIESLHNF